MLNPNLDPTMGSGFVQATPNMGVVFNSLIRPNFCYNV